MDREIIAQAVDKILRDYLELSPDRVLTPGTRLRQDLGTDSLADAEIQMIVEDHFGLSMADEVHVETIGDLIDAVAEQMAMGVDAA